MSGKIDTLGCQELFVDTSEAEAIGGNMRIRFGVRLADGTQGVISLVMPVEAAIGCSRNVNQMARAAFNALMGTNGEKIVAH